MEVNDWRGVVAKQLLTARRYDRSREYTTDRDLASYVDELQGIQHLLSYVRKNREVLGSNLVLDIGAGIAKGASQLKKSPWAKGLRIEATTLSTNAETRNNFGGGLHITPVETLRGVNSLSVAVALSVFGLAYSQSPERTVASLNRVVVPSGVVKASFYFRDLDGSAVMHPKTSNKFVHEFERVGWKVYVDRLEQRRFEILVAVKPPFLEDPEVIMKIDREDYPQQFSEAYKLFPPA